MQERPYISWEQHRQQAPAFLNRVLELAGQNKIMLIGRQIDHMGLRIAINGHVDQLREELRRVCAGGKPLSSAQVNGREILIFKLEEPIEHNGLSIPCVELPYPKPDHNFQDGWEHVEVVLPSAAETIDAFRGVFKDHFPTVQKLKTDMPSAAGDRRANPTVILERKKGLAIKFHPVSIEELVSEQK